MPAHRRFKQQLTGRLINAVKALVAQCEGREFDSPRLHQLLPYFQEPTARGHPAVRKHALLGHTFGTVRIQDGYKQALEYNLPRTNPKSQLSTGYKKLQPNPESLNRAPTVKSSTLNSQPCSAPTTTPIRDYQP